MKINRINWKPWVTYNIQHVEMLFYFPGSCVYLHVLFYFFQVFLLLASTHSLTLCWLTFLPATSASLELQLPPAKGATGEGSCIKVGVGFTSSLHVCVWVISVCVHAYRAFMHDLPCLCVSLSDLCVYLCLACEYIHAWLMCVEAFIFYMHVWGEKWEKCLVFFSTRQTLSEVFFIFIYNIIHLSFSCFFFKCICSLCDVCVLHSFFLYIVWQL